MSGEDGSEGWARKWVWRTDLEMEIEVGKEEEEHDTWNEL